MQIYEEISNYEINCMNLFRFMRFCRQNMPVAKKSATQDLSCVADFLWTFLLCCLYTMP